MIGRSRTPKSLKRIALRHGYHNFICRLTQLGVFCENSCLVVSSLKMKSNWLLLFFFASGLSSLVYEVVWLRLSMAAFGCNTPLLSIVLSVFMAGLGLGSYAVAKLKPWLERRSHRENLQLYAMCETVIAIGGLAVAPLIAAARGVFDTDLQQIAWASSGHYLVVGAFVTVILLPWTILMGATIPLGMSIIRTSGQASARSFSSLYAANLLGATIGTLAAALVLIEHLGFLGTLVPAIGLNLLIAAGAALMSVCSPPMAEGGEPQPTGATDARNPIGPPRKAMLILFVSGLTSMAMEIVWFRLYTVYLKTSVYAFAEVLSVYLVANFAGSIMYRKMAAGHRLPSHSIILSCLGACGVMTLVCTDPVIFGGSWIPFWRLLVGVSPFAFLLGFLTPQLVDQLAAGSPDRAGRAYAINILGCILGPLLASFILLPLLGEKGTVLVLVVPHFLFALDLLRSGPARQKVLTKGPALVWIGAVFLAWSVSMHSRTVYERYQLLAPSARITRDFEATTLALADGPDFEAKLLVNGYGMTVKTPVTKTMAHFPLALLPHPAERVLVICFGMGTTFRSAMTWGVKVDTVDLVPGVPKMFDVFFTDGPALSHDPRGRIIIDDGRRFLRRTTNRYDVIIIDPPPPVESAATSLLYSVEFFEIAKRRLKPHGIVQHWVPTTSAETVSSILKAALHSFKHVRTMNSLWGLGVHIVCSDEPIPMLTAEQMASRMPPEAAHDFSEWGPHPTARSQFAQLLSAEIPVQQLIQRAPMACTMRDDRPYNEYHLIRDCFPHWWAWWMSHQAAN